MQSRIWLQVAAPLSLALLPVVLVQARQVLRTTPRLPEAAGPRSGSMPGPGPGLHLLVVGESTVAGVGATVQEEALAARTAQALAASTRCTVHWRALGRNGATARTASRELLTPAEDLDADLVLIVLGVNDTLRLHGARRWVRDLTQLIGLVRHRCGPVPILIAGLPPLGSFPAFPASLRTVFGLRARLLDRAAQVLAARLDGVTFVAGPDPQADVGRYFCADRFHPSPLGYKVWGTDLARAAVEALHAVQHGPRAPQVARQRA